MRRITQLPNHIRVVTEQLKDRDSASIGIWFSAGGRYEQNADKGVAHFLEHIVFKGSRKYSCDEIKQLVEGVGGSLNAFTGEEETCYYAKVPARHLARAFDVLADISFFPAITARDLEKERAVILEEIKMYRDLPQYYVGELLEELLWPDHPLGKSLAGTPQTVGALQVKDVRAFHDRFYAPQNVVVSACGQVKHDDLVALARRQLGRLKANDKMGFMTARREQDRPAARLYHKSTEQMHLALGYLAYETNHPDYYVLALLSIILGGNMSSRLFNEVREKRGLAYSVSSGIKGLDDTGVFMIRAGVDNAKIVPALDLILKVLKKVIARGISADEFKRAKDYYLGQFLLGLEDTLDHMLWVGGAVISNDQVKTMQDVVHKIEAVNLADIKRVARHVLAPNRLNAAIIGPLTAAQEKEIRNIAGIV
ncbi:MAG: insulinase family protein [Candidatus Omnitrophica bacterium]|nr:insulinase family protein [Candidatus Omnitrophota bacterium]